MTSSNRVDAVPPLESLEEVGMKLWLNVAEGAEYAGVCRDLIEDACAARRIHDNCVGGTALSA